MNGIGRPSAHLLGICPLRPQIDRPSRLHPVGLQREGAADALRFALQVGVDRSQPLLPVAPVVAHLAANGFQLFGIGDVAQFEQQLVGIVLDAAAAAEDALALL